MSSTHIELSPNPSATFFPPSSIVTPSNYSAKGIHFGTVKVLLLIFVMILVPPVYSESIVTEAPNPSHCATNHFPATIPEVFLFVTNQCLTSELEPDPPQQLLIETVNCRFHRQPALNCRNPATRWFNSRLPFTSKQLSLLGLVMYWHLADHRLYHSAAPTTREAPPPARTSNNVNNRTIP
jgi:hypothetical protein